MINIGYGCDVSHHQATSVIPSSGADFVQVRFNYGAEFRDERAVAHCKRVRETGAKLGGYFFFRNIHSVDAQLALFRQVAEDVEYDAGDIVPEIDIEADPEPSLRPVDPSWSAPAQEATERLVEIYGDCIVYMTQREWHMMGSPSWVLRRPLSVAHYTTAPAPATPGNMPATLWQRRVGLFDRHGPGGVYDQGNPRQIDQSVLLQPLPIIGELQSDAEKKRISDLIALNLSEAAQQNWNDNGPPEEIA